MAKETNTNATHLTLPDIHLARQLFGEHNAHLNKIAQSLDVAIQTRGNTVMIRGESYAEAPALPTSG